MHDVRSLFLSLSLSLSLYLLGSPSCCKSGRRRCCKGQRFWCCHGLSRWRSLCCTSCACRRLRIRRSGVDIRLESFWGARWRRHVCRTACTWCSRAGLWCCGGRRSGQSNGGSQGSKCKTMQSLRYKQQKLCCIL